MKKKKKPKILIMFSGGLDSRLVVKLLQEKKYKIEAIFFNLPFGAGCCDSNCTFNFSQLSGIKLHIIDCTKGKNLQQYLDIIKKPKHGWGSGINPCIDCRIYMLKKAKQFMKKNKFDLIATGEVLGERPMRQHKKAMQIIEREAGLEGKIIRPLTDWLNITGRNRKPQIKLAKKFKIKYPHPAGGCLLCEKVFSKRLRFILKKKVRFNENKVMLLKLGRHFWINGRWIILGRNKKENNILETLKKENRLLIPKIPGPSALIIGKADKKLEEKVKKLMKSYSKGSTIDDRKKFGKFRVT